MHPDPLDGARNALGLHIVLRLGETVEEIVKDLLAAFLGIGGLDLGAGGHIRPVSGRRDGGLNRKGGKGRSEEARTQEDEEAGAHE